MESPEEKVSDQFTAPSDARTDAPSEPFLPTRDELQQIAAFWMGVLVTHAFRVAVLGGPTGSDETTLAVQRLTKVASSLTRQELAAAFQDMECKFPSKHDPEDYLGFLRGEVLREGGEGAPGLGNELPPAGDYECFDPVASISQTAGSERKREPSPDVDELVLPTGDARVSVGFVDEICGTGGRLMPEYAPIRPELVQLVKYWVSEIAEVEYFEFCSQQFGSCDRRLKTFGRRRINRLGTMLTDIEMYWAIEQAETEFRDGIPPKLWELFPELSGKTDCTTPSSVRRPARTARPPLVIRLKALFGFSCAVTSSILRVMEPLGSRLRSQILEKLGRMEGQPDGIRAEYRHIDDGG